MISRKVSILSSMILVSGMCIVIAGDGDGPLLPPQSSFRGVPFEEWSFLWSQRTIELNLAGSTDVPETLKNVRFLPSVVTPGSYDFDVKLPPGTGFVTSPFFIFGEHYDDP